MVLLPETKEKRSSCLSSSAVAEVFVVKTDRIFFLAIVSEGKNHSHRTHGYISFSDGNCFRFFQTSDNIVELREKTKTVGERLAKVYGGTLSKERMFHRDGTIKPRLRKKKTKTNEDPA